MDTTDIRTKCGQIFILPNNNFLLIFDCEFCGYTFDTLEDFRAHITQHFLKSPASIKKEDSITCGSDRESISSVEEEEENCIDYHYLQDNIKDESTAAAHHLLNDKFGSSKLSDTFQSGRSKINHLKRIHELQSNSENDIENTAEPRRFTTGVEKVPVPINLNDKKEAKSSKCSSELKNIELISGTEKNQGFECRYCRKIFKITRTRDDHENSHTGKRPHQCQICFRTFAGSSALWSHNKSHTDRRNKCSSCDRSFITKASRDVHTRENHLQDNDARRYFSCNHCAAKFKTLSQLATHRQTHRKKITIFTCDYCQKQTTRKSNMEVHVRIHSGTKPYKCKYCDIGFASDSGRRRHERKTCLKN